jgi:hypothetical protein
VTPGEQVVENLLAKGWITQEGLNKARERYGLPPREQG